MLCKEPYEVGLMGRREGKVSRGSKGWFPGSCHHLYFQEAEGRGNKTNTKQGAAFTVERLLVAL